MIELKKKNYKLICLFLMKNTRDIITHHFEQLSHNYAALIVELHAEHRANCSSLGDFSMTELSELIHGIPGLV